ncbi:ABC transporter substrate-binding protein [Corticicoccus populi]|uniref:ABC transporter substrate-binding protein n=1 Tax=Corticicoccus populi TaxID=1812821 RepID=A0ABW5WVL2_9STAP
MRKRYIFILLSLAVFLSGCGSYEEKNDEIRIAYFPNFTHITTIVALEKGYFEEEFGHSVNIETMTFPNGSSFMEAMSTNEFDIGTVGPTPATTTYTRYPEHEIILGAANGGAVLVSGENSGIESVEDLDGKRVAVPTIGSTQDIQLRYELAEVGLQLEDAGGTVKLVPQAPADTSSLLIQENVDAAATQEPWGVYMEHQANADIIQDETEFGWGTESTTTVVAARKSFTEANPGLTEDYTRAHIKAVEFIEENEEEAVQIFISHMHELTGEELDFDETLKASRRLSPSYDINEEVMQDMADISYEAHYIPTNDINGLVNLEFLERVLKENEE